MPRLCVNDARYIAAEEGELRPDMVEAFYQVAMTG